MISFPKLNIIKCTVLPDRSIFFKEIENIICFLKLVDFFLYLFVNICKKKMSTESVKLCVTGINISFKKCFLVLRLLYVRCKAKQKLKST